MKSTKSANSGAKRITRSEAIRLLSSLPANEIAGVVFVARGQARVSPYLRKMSFKKGVTRHLKGGKRRYNTSEQGLMGVYELVNLNTALSRYQDAARGEVRTLEKELTPAREALALAQSSLAAKNIKKNREAVRVKQNKLTRIEENLAHARLKLSNPEAALKAEIQERMANRRAELTELRAKTQQDGSEKSALEARLAEIEQRLSREEELLADPMQSLLLRYRNINLAGLVELTIAGQVYKVTTKPTPALQTSAPAVENED